MTTATTTTKGETMTKEQANAISTTILNQLGGGGRLAAMIGARHFVSHENGELTFRFKGSRRVNMLRVSLNASDTYTVEFMKYSPQRFTAATVEEFSGVYCDMLQDLFESTTGLYIRF